MKIVKIVTSFSLHLHHLFSNTTNRCHNTNYISTITTKSKSKTHYLYDSLQKINSIFFSNTMSTSVYPTINLDNFYTNTTCSKQNSYFWGTPYKFNAKELDSETNLYYYGARFYTAMENIWLSVDPLSDKYPSLSPYAYCANNPVILVDPDGREMWIALESSSEQKPVFVKYKNHKLYNKDGSLYKGKDEFALNVCKSLNEIANTNDEFTKLVVNQLETSDKIHTIQKDKSGNNNNQVFPQGSNYIPVEKGERTGSNIVLSMTESPIENNLKTTNATTLGHELRHAFDYDQGLFKGSNISDKNRGTAKDPAEIRAVGFENRIRKNQNLPLRTTYGNKPIKKYNQTR